MFQKMITLLGLAYLTVATLGCAATENAFVSVKNYTRGEIFLQQGDYATCRTHFSDEIRKYADDANAHYYLGRCSLALEKNRPALTHLQKAVSLDRGNPDYHFWLGVAFAANDDAGNERRSYEDALAIKSDHLQALVYLGHNAYEAGRYRHALGYYNRALLKDPWIAAALFNRAMALRQLQRTPEEINAWKTYLDAYADGALARRAADYLNHYGHFDYRNHTIGKRTLTLAQVQFAPSGAGIRKASYPSLKKLARVTAEMPRLVLHIVAYQKNNTKLAEMRAKSVKKFLLDQDSRNDASRIKVSWFDQPETVETGQRVHRLESTVNFFGRSR
jgi:tetratricopeptide (TPR) repeat protein